MDTPGAKDQDRLIETVQYALANGHLEVPSLPEIVSRINHAVMDPGLGMDEVSRLIQADAAMAGRIIQICNSPGYQAGVEIDSCVSAVMRLGLKVTRDIVTCLALHNVFNGSSRQYRSLVQTIWRRSAYVGAISFVLGKLIPGLDENKAMLAGLTYDIGYLPVFHYAHELGLDLDMPFLESLRMIKLVAEVGEAVLQRWKLPPEIHAIPRSARDWLRESDANTDYVDIVIVARAHDCLLEKRRCDMPPMLEMPAFAKMSLSELGPDASLEVIDAARHDIKRMVSTLMAVI